MSCEPSYDLRCDDCKTEFPDLDAWRQPTAARMRFVASIRNWTYRDGRDLCPACDLKYLHPLPPHTKDNHT